MDDEKFDENFQSKNSATENKCKVMVINWDLQ